MKLLNQMGRQSKYVISAKELMAMGIKFPGFQRELCAEHVNKIYDFQREIYNRLGFFMFPGELEFCRYNQEIYCIDGQHRYHAIDLLLADSICLDFELNLEIIECQTSEEMIQWFHIINSNRPIPQFLLDDKCNFDRAQILKNHIKTTYPGFISQSARPNRPNINLDLFLEDLVKKYQLNDIEDVVEWFEMQNDEHMEYLDTQRGHEQISKCLDKINTTTRLRSGRRLYLGCYWLDSIKNKVSQVMRKKLWKTWYSEQPEGNKSQNGEVLCPCCELQPIDAYSFEAGHRKSFKNGGTNELVNLIPICSLCNKSMGIMDYDQYKSTLK